MASSLPRCGAAGVVWGGVRRHRQVRARPDAKREPPGAWCPRGPASLMARGGLRLMVASELGGELGRCGWARGAQSRARHRVLLRRPAPGPVSVCARRCARTWTSRLSSRGASSRTRPRVRDPTGLQTKTLEPSGQPPDAPCLPTPPTFRPPAVPPGALPAPPAHPHRGPGLPVGPPRGAGGRLAHALPVHQPRPLPPAWALPGAGTAPFLLRFHGKRISGGLSCTSASPCAWCTCALQRPYDNDAEGLTVLGGPQPAAAGATVGRQLMHPGALGVAGGSRDGLQAPTEGPVTGLSPAAWERFFERTQKLLSRRGCANTTCRCYRWVVAKGVGTALPQLRARGACRLTRRCVVVGTLRSKRDTSAPRQERHRPEPCARVLARAPVAGGQ